MTDNPTIETSNLPAIADNAISAINSYLASEDPQTMIGKLITYATFGIGLSMTFLNPQRRAFHDYLSGTRLIQYR